MLFLITGASAHAGPPDKQREVEARADFAAGRYQEAVDAFAHLYANTADPVFLRNIGRCYQKMRRPREAIDAFQEYLHKAEKLSRAERQEIEGYIREMEALDVAEAKTPPTSTPAPEAAPSPPPAIVHAPESVGPVAAAPAGPPVAAPSSVLVAGPAAVAASGRSWRVVGIATAAAGVGLVAVGIAFGHAAESAADSVSRQYSASTESDGKRDVTLQWVGYGVGVAAVAAGALLYLHGQGLDAAQDRPNSVHALPMLGPNSAGLALGGVLP